MPSACMTVTPPVNGPTITPARMYPTISGWPVRRATTPPASAAASTRVRSATSSIVPAAYTDGAGRGARVALREQLIAGRGRHRDHAWMLEAALGGDDVVPLADNLGPAGHADAVEARDVALDRGRRREDAAHGVAEDGHQRRVFELRLQRGADPFMLEPLLERAPQRAVGGRQDDRRILQRPGKAPPHARRQLRRREERRRRLADGVVEHLDRQIARRRRVGDDHVERIGGELSDELLRIVLAADEP